ncbi:acyl carrier protein [Mycolicibacterium palauense]|uniref:acyl carrier protein n=1 Tax=Mycolicibacterium palauense TaxID=2034511 RepID=UPI001C3F1939|nr:acyl carrier protein [Mycolicibacterium palauense]
MSVIEENTRGAQDPSGGDYERLVGWLIDTVAGHLHLPPDAVGVDTPLADLGIDSVTALALCADLRREKGFDVDTTIVWDHPTIEDIAAHLLGEDRS